MDIDERTWAYAQSLGPTEDEPLRAARARSEEADLATVPAETGILLRWLARLGPARTVVEIGSGGGYSGLWLLHGMDPAGALTTIEAEPDYRGLAQQAYSEAGVSDRVRSILGPALTVLPKLADHTYDLMFCDALKSEYPEYLAHARRMLRPGGLLVADLALWSDHDPDLADADDEAEGLRAFTTAVADDPAFDSQLLPVGQGLLVAVHHPDAP